MKKNLNYEELQVKKINEDKEEAILLSYQDGLKGESGTLNVPLKNQIN